MLERFFRHDKQRTLVNTDGTEKHLREWLSELETRIKRLEIGSAGVDSETENIRKGLHELQELFEQRLNSLNMRISRRIHELAEAPAVSVGNTNAGTDDKLSRARAFLASRRAEHGKGKVTEQLVKQAEHGENIHS